MRQTEKPSEVDFSGSLYLLFSYLFWIHVIINLYKVHIETHIPVFGIW